MHSFRSLGVCVCMNFVITCMGLHALKCARGRLLSAGVHAVRWLHQGLEEYFPLTFFPLLSFTNVIHIGWS